MTLVLKDLIVCEYKYKVIPHFIFYPRLGEGQFIALNTVGYGDLIERAARWDKLSPIFPKNEITMHEDLTHNDVVIRQINASTPLKRLLEERLNQASQSSPFSFPRDFYGDARYWLRASLPMKLTMIAFMFMYVP